MPNLHPVTKRFVADELAGRRFGRLTVLRRNGTKGHAAIWLCRCDCGREKSVASNAMTSGKTRSCGCGRHIPRPWLRIRPYEALYNAWRKLCAARDLRVEITYEQFVSYTQTAQCFYCGESVAWAEHNPGKCGATACVNLDRKDSSLGYSSENIVVCCRRCNLSKRDLFTCEEFLVMMAALREHRKKTSKIGGGPVPGTTISVQ